MADQVTPFNLVVVWNVLTRRWKAIVSFVLVSTVIAILLAYLVLPKLYKSTAVVVAANPALADKGRLFNNNIQQLYSPYGSGDDLNRLLAIAKLDSVRLQLVSEFNLTSYYKTESSQAPQKLAAKMLQRDIEIVKTENEELQLSILTKDPALSSKIINRLVEIIESIASRSWRNEYLRTLQAITDASKAIKQAATEKDSLPANFAEQRIIKTISQADEYEKLANEYRLAINNNASSLVVLQSAFPSQSPDRPRKLLIVIGAMITAGLFAVFAALIFDRNKHS